MQAGKRGHKDCAKCVPAYSGQAENQRLCIVIFDLNLHVVRFANFIDQP